RETAVERRRRRAELVHVLLRGVHEDGALVAEELRAQRLGEDVVTLRGLLERKRRRREHGGLRLGRRVAVAPLADVLAQLRQLPPRDGGVADVAQLAQLARDL